MNIVKLCTELNKNIDSEYQKLSDRFHDLELSHNRKKEALEILLGALENYRCRIDFCLLPEEVENYEKLIKDALFSDGRAVVDGRHGVQHRKKITMRDIKKGAKNG